MKAKDYGRLARLSLKSRKKTTRQTVVGISFGLILLFPLLFIIMAFYGGFTQEINRDAGSRTFNINYVDKKLSNPNNTSITACYSEYKSTIENVKGINKTLDYTLNLTIVDELTPASFSIDGGKATNFNWNRRINRTTVGTVVIDSADAHDPFISADYWGGARARIPLMAGNTFSEGNSKGEVMVSSAFCTTYDIDQTSIVGRKLTFNTYTEPYGMSFSSSETEINDTIGLRYSRNVACFKEYTVVGVFNSQIYNKNTVRKNAATIGNYQEDAKNANIYFWISSDSLDPTGASYPTYKGVTKTETWDGEEHTYYNEFAYYPEHPLTIGKTVTGDGYAYFPIGLGVVNNSCFDMNYKVTEMVEYGTFDIAKAAYNEILTYYEDSYDPAVIENASVQGSTFAPATFVVYLQFYDIFLYVSLGLAVLGGVIFVATLLNLINTLHFSIKSMKGFLGICRAEGLRRNGVIRLFLNQILWIFFYAYIATAILGTGICVGIIFGFNGAVSGLFEEMSSITVTLQWYYIPIALGILVVVTTLLSLIFAVLLAGKTSRTPVLEILSEETK